MTTLTPARISELLAMCEAATEGPWWTSGEELRMVIRDGSAMIVAVRHRIPASQHAANFKFIASARTALPEALREIGRLTISPTEREVWKQNVEGYMAERDAAQEALAKVTAERDEARMWRDSWANTAADNGAKLSTCEAERDALREVLSWYALDSTWRCEHHRTESTGFDLPSAGQTDAGTRARAALAKDPAP